MARIRGVLKDFIALYGRSLSRAELAVEREARGRNAGILSYTTVDQADALSKLLGLSPGMRVLEVGAGSGWPGLYLAKTTGCHVTLTDVPAPGIKIAFARALKQGIAGRCAFAVASGTHLPFRSAAFDAVLHTDVL